MAKLVIGSTSKMRARRLTGERNHDEERGKLFENELKDAIDEQGRTKTAPYQLREATYLDHQVLFEDCLGWVEFLAEPAEHYQHCARHANRLLSVVGGRRRVKMEVMTVTRRLRVGW